MTKKHHQQDSEGIDSKHSCREKTHFNISKVLRKSLPISMNHNYQSEKEALFYRPHVFLIFFPFFNCPTKCRISLLWSCTLTDPWYKVARAPDEVQWVGSGNLLLTFVNICIILVEIFFQNCSWNYFSSFISFFSLPFLRLLSSSAALLDVEKTSWVDPYIFSVSIFLVVVFSRSSPSLFS